MRFDKVVLLIFAPFREDGGMGVFFTVALLAQTEFELLGSNVSQIDISLI